MSIPAVTKRDDDWVKLYDDSADSTYFFNPETGEASWIKPIIDERVKELEKKLEKELNACEEREGILKTKLDESNKTESELKEKAEEELDEAVSRIAELENELKSLPTIWSISTDKSGKLYYYTKSDGNKHRQYDMPQNGSIISIKPRQLEYYITSKNMLEQQLEELKNELTSQGQYIPTKPPIEGSRSIYPTETDKSHQSATGVSMEDIDLNFGGARTRKKRRAVVKRTKSRRKFTKRTKSRRKLSNRTKNKKQ